MVFQDASIMAIIIIDSNQKSTMSKEKAEKPQPKAKIHKDLGFLLDITYTLVTPRSAKYLLQEGSGQIIDSLKENPFDAFCSYIKYDYEGKMIEKVQNYKVPSDRSDPLQKEVLSMRLKEKAWFNICTRAIESITSNQPVMIEGGIIEQDLPETKQQFEADEFEREPSGYHYQVFLDRVEFKNVEKIEIKRKIYELNREKGKKLFEERKYFEASKVYKFITHISENLPKYKYSEQELDEIENMNFNSKKNYIRCYFKITEEWNKKDFREFAKQTLDSMLQKRANDHMVLFFNAKWLLSERMLDDAYRAAVKSNSMVKNQATIELIEEISREIKNKGKIRVQVYK